MGVDFYELPASRGHALQHWASRFGFGAPTGIDVGPEAAGLVPTPEWRASSFGGPQYGEIDRIWKPGYSIQMAIGQGDLNVTPLQMTRFYAMLANGGQLVTPHIVEDVEQPTATRTPPQVLRALQPRSRRPRAASTRRRSRSSRRGSTRRRTPRSAPPRASSAPSPISIAGKTGTAEKLITLPGYSHAAEARPVLVVRLRARPTRREIVVCAVIENGGHGGTAAAPAALKVFEKFFHVKGDDRDLRT